MLLSSFSTIHAWVFGYAILSIVIYTVIYNASSIAKGFQKLASNERQSAIGLVFFQRTLGFLLFGVFPLTLIALTLKLDFPAVGLEFTNGWSTTGFIVATIILMMPFNYFNAKQAETRKHYPQIRVKEWSMPLFMANAFFWVLYLWGYEFLFRGFLFFTSLNVMTLPWAIVFNIALYAFAHWPKGWREVLGAVPFGFLLCVVTYVTGNFWFAFLSHSFLALSAEWFSLKANPEMVWAKETQAQTKAEQYFNRFE